MPSRLLCDKRDYELLTIVREALDTEGAAAGDRRVWHPFLHPHGIKELAESRGLRIAYAVAHLLASLEAGELEQRLNALRILRMEVVDTAMGPLRRNTARVLLSVMKDLVRSPGEGRRQVELAHDFRMAATGKPRVVRAMLKRYHLLEMPEEWNQVAFDDHVHDAFTKGRKTSTHLIMDAWIKGIRRLRVIYYNYVSPGVAAELLQAAAIMGVEVRIGIEFSARFRGRFAHLVWSPRGFPDTESFLCFLAEPQVQAFMDRGREVSAFQSAYVSKALEAFNRIHAKELANLLGVEVPALDKEDFLEFVGAGQPSLLHLGSYIHGKLQPAMAAAAKTWREAWPELDEKQRERARARISACNALDPMAIADRYLEPKNNPDLENPNVPSDEPGTPSLLRLSPRELVDQLAQLHTDHKITLNLSGLRAEDVLEILYQCEGAITRLEIFNLKDHAAGQTGHVAEIARLQRAVNQGNVVTLKQVITEIMDKVSAAGGADAEDRLASLREVLHDIESLRAWYAATALEARIGSDSAGRGSKSPGMGLALADTLPRRARRQIASPTSAPLVVVPMRITALKRKTYLPRDKEGPLLSLLRRLPGMERAGSRVVEDWQVLDKSIRMETPGNIVSLGGKSASTEAPLILFPESSRQRSWVSWTYLNSKVKNVLKVLLGFAPAFLTFYLTKEWWVLAWLGALIWFSITGLRNILQSVLGGGGIRRSPLLKWNDLVSWDRLTDSLFFTGFSVPLLEYVVKTLLCERALGVTAGDDPVALFAILALANGLYISGHNMFRGLPRAAAAGNFFRTVLSIPIAVAANAVLGGVLSLAGVPDAPAVMQKWAAIVSKASSDCVAGFIEGLADRAVNMAQRRRDYRDRFSRIMDAYATLELLYPEQHAVELLAEPQKFRTAKAEAQDLEKIFIICALDLAYFWMYQPRARTAFARFMKNIPEEQRRVFFLSQKVLEGERQISLLFINGLVGANFRRALAFYLSRAKGYLATMAGYEAAFHKAE
ncbi:MAG: hypothetical protein JRI97_03150 [Deltaproteobacteria bacterium]|nr:hypothetical protein [Deltaproteobacteria bacterium]